MELFLDTANVAEIRQLNGLLTLAGVTTNPTILTRSGKEPMAAIRAILDVLSPEQKFFAQVLAQDREGMVEEARTICALRDKNTYVKIPVTDEGLKAIKECKELGLGVLATAIYSADQAFLAAMNGADYLAPYVNRMDNYGDGVAEVIDLMEMLAVNGMSARIIAASFKNKRQVHALITAGVQAVTVPADVLRAMMWHPGTDIAVREFTDNWKSVYGRERF